MIGTVISIQEGSGFSAKTKYFIRRKKKWIQVHPNQMSGLYFGQVGLEQKTEEEIKHLTPSLVLEGIKNNTITHPIHLHALDDGSTIETSSGDSHTKKNGKWGDFDIHHFSGEIRYGLKVKKTASLREEFVRIARETPSTRPTLVPLLKQADKWEKLPKGWTEESVKKFWSSLTGGSKHKVTRCIEKMKDKDIGDPGAFCAALADKVLGPEWRKKKASEFRAWSVGELEAFSSGEGLINENGVYFIRAPHKMGGWVGGHPAREILGGLIQPIGKMKNLSEKEVISALVEIADVSQREAWVEVPTKTRTFAEKIAKFISTPQGKKMLLSRVKKLGSKATNIGEMNLNHNGSQIIVDLEV